MRHGDARALEDLYDRYAPTLHAVALKILGRRDLADDAVQQTWIQAWRQAGRFKDGRGSVLGWLVMMVRSRALDLRRRQQTRSRLETDAASEPSSRSPAGHSADPVDAASTAQRRAAIRGALEALDPRMRSVIERAFFGGQTQREIAATQDVPLGTVKTWTRRGLDALRGLLPKGGEA